MYVDSVNVENFPELCYSNSDKEHVDLPDDFDFFSD